MSKNIDLRDPDPEQIRGLLREAQNLRKLNRELRKANEVLEEQLRAVRVDLSHAQFICWILTSPRAAA